MLSLLTQAEFCALYNQNLKCGPIPEDWIPLKYCGQTSIYGSSSVGTAVTFTYKPALADWIPPEVISCYRDSDGHLFMIHQDANQWHVLSEIPYTTYKIRDPLDLQKILPIKLIFPALPGFKRRMAITQFLNLHNKGNVPHGHYLALAQEWGWGDIAPLDKWAESLELPLLHKLRNLVTHRMHELVKIEFDAQRGLTSAMTNVMLPFLAREYTDEEREADRIFKERRETNKVREYRARRATV
jgi:hypothetical protein